MTLHTVTFTVMVEADPTLSRNNVEDAVSLQLWHLADEIDGVETVSVRRETVATVYAEENR